VSAARGLEERFTTHQGRRLRYLIGGRGPHLLLCHGFIGSAENFETWFSELMSRRTLVVPDLPGFGESMPLSGRPHHATALAEAALFAAGDAGADVYDLAGLCLGAGVALAAQRLSPERTQRLVLHTPLLAPHIVRRRFRLQVRVMMAPGVYPAIVWLSRRRIVSDLYKRIMVEGSDVDAAAAQVNFDNQRRADVHAAREWLLEGLRLRDLDALRDPRHPVLILVASDDRIVDVPRLIETVQPGDRVSLAVIDQAGHAWTPAYVRRQLELVSAFLDDRPLPLTSGIAA
jgi:pimeloyl-ACP methyl ester carboxylesterase